MEKAESFKMKVLNHKEEMCRIKGAAIVELVIVCVLTFLVFIYGLLYNVFSYKGSFLSSWEKFSHAFLDSLTYGPAFYLLALVLAGFSLASNTTVKTSYNSKSDIINPDSAKTQIEGFGNLIKIVFHFLCFCFLHILWRIFR